MTMRIGKNDIFKVKTQKNRIFYAETGQDKTKTCQQTENLETNPICANKPKT